MKDAEGCLDPTPGAAECRESAHLAVTASRKRSSSARSPRAGSVAQAVGAAGPDEARKVAAIGELSRKELEDRLRMFQYVVDCLPIGITLSDEEGRIIYSNPAEMEMHGYAPGELIGKEARILAPQILSAPFSPQRDDRGVWKRERVNVRKTGEEFPVRLTSLPVRDDSDAYLGLVTACEDLTERKKEEALLNRLSHSDMLTGLPNRGMFMDRLESHLAQSENKLRRCLLLLDLDNFKDINATHGHDCGDILLREVAARLAGQMRHCDIMGRFGGDKFALAITELESEDMAEKVAERLLSVFAPPFLVDRRTVYTSASIGMAFYPDDGPDAKTLLRCADTALTQAKNQGRRRYSFFSAEMNCSIVRRVALEDSLRQGIARKEFFLHYQPQWEVKTGRLVGVEALVRWQSGEFGLLHPSEFIPMAEKSGYIATLGEWILRTACTQANKWATAGYRGFKVAVNISPGQFRQPGFLEMLATIVRETGIDPQTLDLELTESMIMEQPDRGTILSSIKAMGIQLSIDDFGTGYSSLSYLKDFPIDRIKIDHSFIADIGRNRDDVAIVEAIISMAHALNLQVVAEGVETRGQLDFLASLDCDDVQGFYLAVPMTAHDLTRRLRSAFVRNETLTRKRSVENMMAAGKRGGARCCYIAA